MKKNIYVSHLFTCLLISVFLLQFTVKADDYSFTGKITRTVNETNTTASINVTNCDGTTTVIPGQSYSISKVNTYTSFTNAYIKIYREDTTAGNLVSTIGPLSKATINFIAPPAADSGSFSYTITGLTKSRYTYYALLVLDNSANPSAYAKQFTLPLSGGAFPIGSVISYIGKAATIAGLEESGWYYCNGRAVSGLSSLQSDEKTALTAIIGSNLPDLRAVFLRGVDDGRGWDDDAGSRISGIIDGATGVGSYQTCKIQNHSISGTTNTTGDHTHTGSTGPGGHGTGRTGVDGNSRHAADESGNHTHTLTINNAGDHSHTVSGSYTNSGGNETRPENISVYYLMRCR
jgi:hypothetical protein